MTIEEWVKDFKSYVNALDMPRDDYNGIIEYIDDAIDLLKEQEEVVKQWTMEIAGNQLVHAPNDSHKAMSLDEHLENEYKRGIWDGLQIAWNIISEGR